MISEILPTELLKGLQRLDINKIYEIRLRQNAPVVINYYGKNIVLKKDDLTKENFIATREMIETTLKKATENSIYAYNYQIKQGFITARGGLRLGIAGESVVSENFMPKTMKDICSINIRIPHEVKNCAQVAFKFIYSAETGLKNTLIISPPGAGKTTFLRDISRQISLIQSTIYNVLIVDERFELASVVNGEAMLDVGCFADIVSGASKEFAFENGIRSLRPDVIVTDELISREDSLACEKAIMSGVKVIASVHANSLAQFKEKENFQNLIKERCFERYIVLSNKNGPGTYQGIFDENFNCIYF